VTRQQGLRRFLQPPPGAGPAAARGDGPPGPAPGQPGSPGPAAPGYGPDGQPARPGDPGGQPAELCELCATPVPPAHSHVADLENASLVCACRACYLLFTEPGAGRGRYHSVPDRYLCDPAHPLTSAEWAELDVPVGLAFFLNSSRQGKVCGFYPSPAGATECTLDLEAWARLSRGHPLLPTAEADVEAVLVNRTDAGVECFLVPIDACYELAGRMRLLWQGFDGGAEARQSIAEFLGSVRDRARELAREP
jgi:Family of unknown function (DUF5947)